MVGSFAITGSASQGAGGGGGGGGVPILRSGGCGGYVASLGRMHGAIIGDSKNRCSSRFAVAGSGANTREGWGGEPRTMDGRVYAQQGGGRVETPAGVE